MSRLGGRAAQGGGWGARLVLALLLCLLAAPAAAADPARFAVVMGANRGLPDEGPLQYAEQDAARVAKVLTQLADVPEENLVLLQGSSVERARKVLGEVGARMARLRAEQPAARPLLLLFYSGHSSANALHLGRTPLAFAELRSLVQTAGADASVLVVDGCRSGGLTRTKGGHHAPPFTITLENHLQSKGVAVITSSAADEDAQESDRLGGGIFTSHFIGGLRGAADADGDRRITLGEAYQYAYRETLVSTSRTRFVQHPTYSFQLQGRLDVTLTRVDAAGDEATLRFVDTGYFLVLDRARQAGVVAELQIDRPADIRVPAGSYLIRFQGPRSVREARIHVTEGGRQEIGLAAMAELPYGPSVRRGLRTDSLTAIGVDGGASGPVLAGYAPGWFAALGGAVDTAGARIQARLRYSGTGAHNPDLTATQQAVGVDAAALHVFDLPGVGAGLGVGVRAGVDRVWQVFETRGRAPERAAWLWRAAPLLKLEFAPMPRWLAALECGLDVHLARVERDGARTWETPVAPFCSLGAGVYLP